MSLRGASCDEAIQFPSLQERAWMASPSLSSGAHSRATGWPQWQRGCIGDKVTRNAIVRAVLLAGLRQLLDAATEQRPVRRRPQALHQIHETRIVADQDARLVLLDARDDPQRRSGRRRFRKGVEAFD